MTTPNNKNDGGDNDNGEARKLSPTEAAIIEMMKKQAIGGGVTGLAAGDGETKHAFWDTQVKRNTEREIQLGCLLRTEWGALLITLYRFCVLSLFIVHHL